MFVFLSDVQPLTKGLYRLRNMYACDGSPGAQLGIFTRAFCGAGVQSDPKTNEIAIYKTGEPDIWQLVPREGEHLGYTIRTPQCEDNPDNDNCKYWYMGFKNWIYFDTLSASNRTASDVFYIKPFAKGWKIFPRRANCDMKIHMHFPCLRSLSWDWGAARVKYLGLWTYDSLFHYSIDEV